MAPLWKLLRCARTSPVEICQTKISIILALPLAAIYPVAIMSLPWCRAMLTTSSSCRLKKFYTLVVLFMTTPSAAVVNAM